MITTQLTRLASNVLPLLLCAAAAAQDNPPSQASPPQPSAPPAFTIGPITFSGTIDGYYSFNNNHPASRVNTQHNFDASANSFDLNFAKMKLEMRRIRWALFSILASAPEWRYLAQASLAIQTSPVRRVPFPINS